MRLFRVSGVDAMDRPFRSGFEACNEHALRDYLTAHGVRIETVRAIPLTRWPFTRCILARVLIWLFIPFLTLITALMLPALVGNLRAELGNESAYSDLAERGKQTAGETSAHVVPEELRRNRDEELTYRFKAPDGTVRYGTIVAGVSRLKKREHNFEFVRETPGLKVTVTYLPDELHVHAPFVVDGAFLESHRQTIRWHVRVVIVAVVALIACLWMDYNLALRAFRDDCEHEDYLIEYAGKQGWIALARAEPEWNHRDDQPPPDLSL